MINVRRRFPLGGMAGFSIVWLGQFVSIVGSGMTTFGLGIWAWQATGRATALALVGLCALIPAILASPVAGALVDRWSRKKIMIVADLVAGAGAVFLLILSLLGRLQIWHIYLVAAANGAGGAFQGPAYRASISMMIDKAQYGRAYGMLGMVNSASGIVAPILAGALLGVIGLRGILMIDIATFLFAVGMLLIARIPQPVREDSSVSLGRRHLIRESMFGFRYLAERRPLLHLLLAYASLNIIMTLVFTILTPMVLARTGSNELTLGTVQMFLGLGGVTGGAILTAWGGPSRNLIRWMFAAIAASMLFGISALGVAQSLVVWAAAAFFTLLLATFIQSMSNVLWQRKIPPAVQGRVFAYRGLVSQIASPLGTILAGTLADHVFEPLMATGTSASRLFAPLVGSGPGAGMGLMVVFAGVIGCILGLSGFLVPSIRRLERLIPDADAEGSESDNG